MFFYYDPMKGDETLSKKREKRGKNGKRNVKIDTLRIKSFLHLVTKLNYLSINIRSFWYVSLIGN